MTYAMYSTFRLLIKKYKEKCMFATHFLSSNMHVTLNVCAHVGLQLEEVRKQAQEKAKSLEAAQK